MRSIVGVASGFKLHLLVCSFSLPDLSQSSIQEEFATFATSVFLKPFCLYTVPVCYAEYLCRVELLPPSSSLQELFLGGSACNYVASWCKDTRCCTIFAHNLCHCLVILCLQRRSCYVCSSFMFELCEVLGPRKATW